MKMESHNY